MARSYSYLGSQEIARVVAGYPTGHLIRSVADVEGWMQQTHQQPNRWGLVEATFVITEEGILALADRHSEHVACAGGKPVRSAGEMFFAPGVGGWEVQEVSNQSTGYCPEPASWLAVAAALARIPLAHPGAFTQVCLFRRCPDCQQLNLIKENLFMCAVCGSALPDEWNCGESEQPGQGDTIC